jgi:hypothetical protein
MVRRWRLIAQLGLFGTLILAFPSAGSALSGVVVQLTASGPSPAVLTIPAGLFPFWTNNDHVTHSVTFANGLCSFQLAPGAYGQCNFGFPVGQYAYTVDGTIQASVVVNALPPATVSLTARSHTIPTGRAQLRLHGTLNPSIGGGGGPIVALSMPIVVLARHDRYHPFRRIATVRSEKRTPYGSGFAWQLHLHPKTKSIYIAEVTYQPEGEQGQRQAWSRPFKVSVSHSRLERLGRNLAWASVPDDP